MNHVFRYIFSQLKQNKSNYKVLKFLITFSFNIVNKNYKFFIFETILTFYFFSFEFVTCIYVFLKLRE